MAGPRLKKRNTDRSLEYIEELRSAVTTQKLSAQELFTRLETLEAILVEDSQGLLSLPASPTRKRTHAPGHSLSQTISQTLPQSLLLSPTKLFRNQRSSPQRRFSSVSTTSNSSNSSSQFEEAEDDPTFSKLSSMLVAAVSQARGALDSCHEILDPGIPGHPLTPPQSQSGLEEDGSEFFETPLKGDDSEMWEDLDEDESKFVTPATSRTRKEPILLTTSPVDFVTACEGVEKAIEGLDDLVDQFAQNQRQNETLLDGQTSSFTRLICLGFIVIGLLAVIVGLAFRGAKVSCECFCPVVPPDQI